MGDEVDAYSDLRSNHHHSNDRETGRELASAAAYRIVKSGTKQILKGPSGSGMMASGYVVRHPLPSLHIVFPEVRAFDHLHTTNQFEDDLYPLTFGRMLIILHLAIAMPSVLGFCLRVIVSRHQSASPHSTT